MRYEFLSGLNEVERVHALEQVISGKKKLYASVPVGVVVIPKSHEKAARENALENDELITGYDVKLPLAVRNGNYRGSYLHHKYLVGDQGFIDYCTQETKMFELSDGANIAIQMISDYQGAPGVVINDDGEECYVLNSGIQELESNGLPCFGYSAIVFEDKHLAVACTASFEEEKHFVIETPEYLAIHKVYEFFWSDGKNGAKKTTIVNWIIKEFGFSNKTADVIDTICRPEARRKGGNSKWKRLTP